MSLEKEFDTYELHQWANGHIHEADINCWKSNHPKPILIAKLGFFKDEANIPANSVDAKGILTLNFHINRFSEIITTLRTEKPLHIFYNTQTNMGRISTTEYYMSIDMEKIGEEEGNP